MGKLVGITDSERTEIFERLNQLEERSYKSALDRNKTVPSSAPYKNGNGGGIKDIATFGTICGLIITLLLTLIGGAWTRIDDHANKDGHAQAIAKLSATNSDIRALRENIESMDARVENFKIERQRINKNQSLSETLTERFIDINHRLRAVEDHTSIKGHPHMQTDAMNKLDDRIKRIESKIYSINGTH